MQEDNKEEEGTPKNLKYEYYASDEHDNNFNLDTFNLETFINIENEEARLREERRLEAKRKEQEDMEVSLVKILRMAKK